MSRLAYSKASLHRQSALLKRYRQYLPSLDLKRQQLMAEKNKLQKHIQTTEACILQLQKYIQQHLPMLSVSSIVVEDLVSIDALDIVLENHVGVDLPMIKELRFQEKEYSFFCKPHWVDHYVIKMKQMLTLKMRLHVDQQRLHILDQAVKKVTQRVNLFDKVLIPQARDNIRKIQIYLSDTERAAVVRAKITKNKRVSL